MNPVVLIILKVFLCISAYLVGSINFAIVFSRCQKTDITKVGSGNPGTMNVLRTVGKFWGAMTFLCDALKGIVFALIGRFALESKGFDWLFILGLLVMIGHVFPVYTKFRGGKGVATAIGIFMVAMPIITTIVLTFLIIFLFVAKYGFIGSLISISVLSISAIGLFYNQPAVIVVAVIMCALVFFTHRKNIKRLCNGEENTLQLAKKKAKMEQKIARDADKMMASQSVEQDIKAVDEAEAIDKEKVAVESLEANSKEKVAVDGDKSTEK